MIDLNNHRRIHCIGIGGIGVSALAEIFLSRGYEVSGSDMQESEVTERLREAGATIHNDHRAENVEGSDLVIYSAAISDENPEMVRARELGIEMAVRAEVLGTLMEEYRHSIAISGTHGKTTTTSMVSLILSEAGLDPTILVGGQMDDFGSNVKVGGKQYFVTEACEYRDSFLELRPKIEVILNIDSDHLDYFKDIEHIVQSFERFARMVPADGKIIAYDSNPFVSEVIRDMDNVVTFGYSRSSTYTITGVRFDEGGMPYFHMMYKDTDLGEIRLKIPGEHNILNAAAAFACTHQLGVAPSVICRTLGEFNGTQRRFDIAGRTDNGVLIVDDYAHHPTEIKATLDAAQNIPHKRLWTIFQPHTYTRTLALFDEFADSFVKTDVLILADIYAAREKDIYNVNSQKLAGNISGKYPDKEVYYMDGFEKIAEYVRHHAAPEDLVITMGAGDVYQIGRMILGETDEKPFIEEGIEISSDK